MNSSIHVHIPHCLCVDPEPLRLAANTVLNRQRDTSPSEMTIVLTDDDSIKILNQRHRDSDSPTDVLSFPAAPLPFPLAKGPRYLGDILIAFPYTSSKAQRNNLDLHDVLALLVIHGTLHLLGYHHADDSSRQQMWDEQAAALNAINIKTRIVAAYEDAHDD